MFSWLFITTLNTKRFCIFVVFTVVLIIVLLPAQATQALSLKGTTQTPLTISTDALFLSRLTALPVVEAQHQLLVRNTQELVYALKQANKQGNTHIRLAKGTYTPPSTLFVTANNISITATSDNPFKTVIVGRGMKASKRVDNLMRVSGSNFLLSGVTLQDSPNHLIQIAGENKANAPKIHNCVLQNGYEQLLKVTYDLQKRPDNFSSYGVIENSFFRYTNDVGPNYYIGGIDAHGIQYWKINNNLFENIASPSKHIAEHAIHIWNNTEYNQVTNNIIINSDRGIGFGMYNPSKKIKTDNLRFGNLGGTIEHNIIYHINNTHPYADVGIIVENSPETNITHNIVVLEHAYRSAIEYRFKQSSNVLIANNLTNKRITKRNNAQAVLLNNTTDKLTAKKALINKLAKYINTINSIE